MKAYRDNIIVKALVEYSDPHHDTIAAFISGNGEPVKDLLAQVLLQCAKLDLITGEMIAFDGYKLASYIGRIISRQKEMDNDEKKKRIQAPYKKTMGEDEERRERSIERLEKKLNRPDNFLKTAKAREGVSGLEMQSNITDNESALIKSSHGYKGITIADLGSQIIISAEAIGSGPESGCFPEMLGCFEETMKDLTGKERSLTKAFVEEDAGYLSMKTCRRRQNAGLTY